VMTDFEDFTPREQAEVKAERAVRDATEDALFNFYTAERNAGATPLEANERMHFFATRLDAAKSRMERTR